MNIKKKGSRLIFNNKNGINQELFFNIFEVVLAFIVILSLFYFINDVVKQTIFEKNYLARDLAILVNTIYSAPGDVNYDYKENSDKFQFVFNFTPNKVEVYSYEEKEPGEHLNYLFGEDKIIAFGYKNLIYDKENVKIEFLKSDDYINIDKPKEDFVSGGGRSGSAGANSYKNENK